MILVSLLPDLGGDRVRGPMDMGLCACHCFVVTLLAMANASIAADQMTVVLRNGITVTGEYDDHANTMTLNDGTVVRVPPDQVIERRRATSSPVAVAEAIERSPAATQAPQDQAIATSKRRVRDLRIEIGIGPAPSRVEETLRAGSTSIYASGSYTEELRGGTGAHLRASFTGANLYRGGGFVWGAGVAATSASMEPVQQQSAWREFAYETYGVFLLAGYGHSLGDHAHFEVTPLLGLGAASAEWWDSSASRDYQQTGFGTYSEFGVRAGIYGMLGRRFSLGAFGGYLASIGRVSVDFPATGSASDLTIRSNGGFGGLTAGLRF